LDTETDIAESLTRAVQEHIGTLNGLGQILKDGKVAAAEGVVFRGCCEHTVSHGTSAQPWLQVGASTISSERDRQHDYRCNDQGESR
jgi:hypothetical protein